MSLKLHTIIISRPKPCPIPLHSAKPAKTTKHPFVQHIYTVYTIRPFSRSEAISGTRLVVWVSWTYIQVTLILLNNSPKV